MLSVRRAIESDASALAQLAECTFREAFAADNSHADMDKHCRTNFRADVQQLEIEDANTVTILAETDAELIGFAQVRLFSPKDCVPGSAASELYRIYVAGKWHGRGAAQQLMTEVMSRVIDANSDWMWLGVWEHNSKAIAFYQKWQFEAVGEHSFLLGNDLQRDLIMATTLLPR